MNIFLQNLNKTKKFLYFFIFFLISIASVVWAEPFVGPDDNPPNNNAKVPINTSIYSQTKAGALIISGGFSAATPTLNVLYNTQRVGIGTISPAYKLDVSGDINFTGNLYQNGTLFTGGAEKIDNLTDAQKDTINNNLFLGHSGFSGIFYNNFNTAIGIRAFDNLNINNTQGDYGDSNTAIGYNALTNNTTGSNNSAQGRDVLYFNTTGSNNSAQGRNAIRFNSTGSNNSAQGVSALYFNTTGSNNSAQGVNALFSNTTGSNNSAQGAYALYRLSSGDNNIALGYEAGRRTNAGDNNAIANESLYLGVNSRALASGGINEIVIGYDAVGLGSNTAVLGNDNIITTALKGSVGIGTTSPNTSAILDLTSTTKGALLPRMTTVQRDAISMPANGLLIYNIDTNKYNHYDGNTWLELGGSGGGGGSGSSTFLGLSDTPSNYLAGSILFSGNSAVNQDNFQLFWSDSLNRLGIGTNTPRQKFDLRGVMKIEQGANFDVWIQGGDSFSPGPTRNLALMGSKATDTLVMNYNGEYSGGVKIEGPLTTINGLVGIGTISSPTAQLEVGGGPIKANDGIQTNTIQTISGELRCPAGEVVVGFNTSGLICEAKSGTYQ